MLPFKRKFPIFNMFSVNRQAHHFSKVQVIGRSGYIPILN